VAYSAPAAAVTAVFIIYPAARFILAVCPRDYSTSCSSFMRSLIFGAHAGVEGVFGEACHGTGDARQVEVRPSIPFGLLWVDGLKKQKMYLRGPVRREACQYSQHCT
jgi:hypothetical protein